MRVTHSVRATLVAVFAVLRFVVAAPVSSDGPPPEAALGGAAETAAGAEAASSATEQEDEEFEWMVEEETGLRYRIAKLPRVEGTYMWLSENRVRAALGTEFEVVRSDDDWLWVKTYRFEPPKSRTQPAESSVPVLPLVEPESVDRLRFAPFDEGLPRKGQWREGFDLADVDGDGEVDILFGPPRKGAARIHLFRGDGEGHWDLWTEARFQPAPYDYGDLVAADWNGDGLLDLALGIHLRGLVALVQGPVGRFSLWSEGIALGGAGGKPAFTSRSLLATDWNGDDLVDLVAFGEGPQNTARGGAGKSKVLDQSRGFLLYLNGGDGSWQPYSLTAGGGAQRDFGSDFVRADVDGDGASEIVIASGRYGSRRVLLEEHREPPYLRPRELPGLLDGAGITALAAREPKGEGAAELAVGYLLRDGGQWRTGLDLLSAGEPSHRVPLSLEPERVWIDALTFGDVDGDGRADLVALTGRGGVRVYLATDDGYRAESGEELPAEVAEGCRGSEVRVHDVDGDGRGEIFAAFAGERVGLEGLEVGHPGCPDEGSLRVWSPRPPS